MASGGGWLCFDRLSAASCFFADSFDQVLVLFVCYGLEKNA